VSKTKSSVVEPGKAVARSEWTLKLFSKVHAFLIVKLDVCVLTASCTILRSTIQMRLLPKCHKGSFSPALPLQESRVLKFGTPCVPHYSRISDFSSFLHFVVPCLKTFAMISGLILWLVRRESKGFLPLIIPYDLCILCALPGLPSLLSLSERYADQGAAETAVSHL
jgi:hypothetical protein